MLRVHATWAKRAVTMRDIAREVLASDRPTDANREYGKLARRLCERTRFTPDLREDGTEIWMSTVAEGWQPMDREYEWVMVPSLARLFSSRSGGPA